jgi:hypothetical protein
MQAAVAVVAAVAVAAVAKPRADFAGWIRRRVAPAAFSMRDAKGELSRLSRRVSDQFTFACR